MKVAIVQEEVDLRRGGAETSTVEMARQLAALGVDVTVICRAESATPFVDQNVTFLPVAVRSGSRALRTYRFVQAASRLCRAERFDIVHAITPCPAANVYQPRGGTFAETVARSTALHAAWLRPVKRLGRLFNFRQRFLGRVERLLLTKYAGRMHVAALSEYVRRQVLALGFPPERVQVVFNGVDPPTGAPADRAAVRREQGLTLATPVVLFVAHNFKLKGLRELLRAAAAARSEWTVVVVGRDDPQPYQRLARRLGIDGRVRFVGTTTPIEVWYSVADALAHPTWYDPCSRVVLEALVRGLPVVTTRYNGAAEVMQERTHGVVIAAPNDIAALASGLAAALQPALRGACQADAPRMRAQLSMARHARELLSLYERVLV